MKMFFPHFEKVEDIVLWHCSVVGVQWLNNRLTWNKIGQESKPGPNVLIRWVKSQHLDLNVLIRTIKSQNYQFHYQSL